MRKRRLFPLLIIITVVSLVIGACGGTPEPVSKVEPVATAVPSAPQATAAPAKPVDTPAPSFDAAAHFKGKTIRIYANFPPGGGADLNARVIARNLGDFVPGNPRVVVVSKHGAAGQIGGNYIYNAPPDGLHMGVFTGVHVPAMIMSPGAEYDLREMRPVIGWQPALQFMAAREHVPYDSIEDAVGQGSKGGERVTMPSSVICNTTSLRYRWLIDTLDLPMDIAYGVPTGHVAFTRALDQDLVDVGSTSTGWYDWPNIRPGWWKDGYVRIWMVEVDDSRKINPNTEIGDMPTDRYAIDIIRKHAGEEAVATWIAITADNGPMWRSWWLPKGSSDEITKAIRDAAWEMMNSKQFVDDFERLIQDSLTLNHGDVLETEYLKGIFDNIENVVKSIKEISPECDIKEIS